MLSSSRSRNGGNLRLIVFTGKGGSGASTLAAGTAALAAEAGRRTVAFGLGRGLGVAFDARLASEPAVLSDSLRAVEALAGSAEPDEFREWLEDLLDWRGMDVSLAEDLAGMPGLSHISRLLELAHYAEDPGYEVLVVDAGPLEQFLDLPAALDAAGRWLDRLFAPRQQTVFDPFVRVFAADYASAGEDVLDRGRDLLGRLAGLRRLLQDGSVSAVRIVTTPDRTAASDVRQAIAALSLYCYAVDAIVVSPLLPQVGDPFFGSVRAEQEATIKELEGSAGMPVLRSRLLPAPPRGIDAVAALARAAYARHDPLAVMHSPEEHSFTQEGDAYVMRLALPFALREDLQVEQLDDGVAVHLNGRRCVFPLPEEARDREAASWSFQESVLRIAFPR